LTVGSSGRFHSHLVEPFVGSVQSGVRNRLGAAISRPKSSPPVSWWRFQAVNRSRRDRMMEPKVVSTSELFLLTALREASRV